MIALGSVSAGGSSRQRMGWRRVLGNMFLIAGCLQEAVDPRDCKHEVVSLG